MRSCLLAQSSANIKAGWSVFGGGGGRDVDGAGQQRSSRWRLDDIHGIAGDASINGFMVYIGESCA